MDQIKFYRGQRSAYNNTTQTKNAVFFAQDNGEILNNGLSFRPTSGTGLTYSNNTLNHSNSVSAGTAKGDDSKTLTFGGTFTIPSITFDAQGHITGKGTTTMTLPLSSNSDTLVTQTLDTTNTERPILLSSSTSTGTRTSLMTTGVTINPSTKTVTASTFSGDLSGTATKASQDASGNVITTTYATKTTATTSANGLMSSADKTKLDGIASGAEVNVNADWTATSGYALILNKPELSNVKYIDAVVVQDLPTNSQYLMDIYSYGIQWDSTVADPTCTRIGNPLLHKSLPIQSSYKGCIAKGKDIKYYLDPNNWAYKADGTASVLDGTDGDVRVHTNRFYGKSGVTGTTNWVRISPIQIDSTWLEIPEMVVDFSHTCLDRTNSKTCCICNTSTQYRGAYNDSSYDTYLDTDVFRTQLGKPATNISRATFRTYAKNNDSENLCMIYYQWIFGWNFSIEYNTLNVQAAYNASLTTEGYHQGGLGAGISIMPDWDKYNNYCPITPCGYTNDIGNFTGIKEIPSITYTNGTTTYTRPTMYATRWRGFENPFGDVWMNLDGVVLKRDTAGAVSNVYATTDPSAFDDQITNKTIIGTEVASDGWIKAFDLGLTGNIIPSAVGGSSTTYMCDYHWCNSSYTDARTLLVGGAAGSGAAAGLFCFNSGAGVGIAAQGVGFRTLTRL